MSNRTGSGKRFTAECRRHYTTVQRILRLTRVATETASVAAMGFTTYKLHSDKMDVEEVIKTIDTVRATVPNMNLMLDPNNGYTMEQVLRVGRLGANSFQWSGDPVVWNGWHAVRELNHRLDTPAAMSDANGFMLMATARALGDGDLRVVRETVRKLGITGLRKLCALAEVLRSMCEIELAGNSFMNAANLHVICATSNCSFYGWWMPEKLHQWGQLKKLHRILTGNLHCLLLPVWG